MYILLLNLCLYFGILQQSDVFKLKELNWLIGEWHRSTADKKSVEKWTEVSNHTFEGLAFNVQNGDTTITEYLRLEQFGDEIFFTARVAHNEFPVSFRLVFLENNKCIFENPGHDFPQRIIYQLKQNNQLYARVEKTAQNKTSGFDYLYDKAGK